MADGDIAERLLIEEYKSCRELIAKNIDIIEKTEVYAVGASAAIIVFSLSATVRTVGVVSAWLPAVIAILGFARFIGIDDVIDKINNYIEKLEAEHRSISWTTFYRKNNRKKFWFWPRPVRKILKMTRYAIWIMLILVSLFFGGFMSYNAPISRADGLYGQDFKLRHYPAISARLPDLAVTVADVGKASGGEKSKQR